MSVVQASPASPKPASGLRVERIAGGDAEELFLTGSLEPGSAPDALLEQAVRSTSARDARICRQRVFVPAGQLSAYRAAHAKVFGEANVPTQWLYSGTDRGAIQFYAVAGADDWTPLVQAGKVRGWSYRIGNSRYALTAGLAGDISATAPQQTREAFAAGESLLAQAGMSLSDVARTWIYMDHITAWYGELNAIRNELFAERGLLVCGQSPTVCRVPASTGMGVSPVGGARITIEFCAASGAGIDRLAAAGRQRAAYEYGSAFARAAEVTAAGRSTLYISGTAAIDGEGRTCHPYDIDGQIGMTLENVCAILKQRGYPSGCVVEAIAYCKSASVVKAFESRFRNALPWPWVVIIGDICRSDLLFEVEATVARPEEFRPCA